MKLNTKKTKGECKCTVVTSENGQGEIVYCKKHCRCQCHPYIYLNEGIQECIHCQPTEKQVGYQKQCQLGKKDCPCIEPTEKPMDKLGNPHLISYQQGWNEALAEYKQKLIKRIKGLYKRNTPMGMIEKINYNNAIRDVLDEVEAVIKDL